MKIGVNWGNHTHSLILLDFSPGWTRDDLYAAIQQADELITSVTHTVNLIIDISHAGSLPNDFMRVAGDILAQGEARHNEGVRVIVGAGGLIRITYGAIQKVYGHKLQNRPLLFASSIDEARALLRN